MKQYPRIYDAHMRPLGDLRTAEFTDLKQRQTPFDTVTLTVPTADAGSFGYRQFVELFDADGRRIDIFRISEVPKKTYRGLHKNANKLFALFISANLYMLARACRSLKKPETA